MGIPLFVVRYCSLGSRFINSCLWRSLKKVLVCFKIYAHENLGLPCVGELGAWAAAIGDRITSRNTQYLYSFSETINIAEATLP